RLRLHTAAPRTRSCSRSDRSLAFRLRKPGDFLRPARSARSAHAAICRRGGWSYSAAARDYSRTRVRPLHQLRADERHLRAASGPVAVPDAQAGRRSEIGAAEEFRLTPNAVLFGTSS